MSLPSTLVPKALLEVVGARPLIREDAIPPPVRSRSKVSLPSRIAVIGNYLPRHCGIATFTTDLGAYTPNQGGAYAGEVIHGQVTGPMSGRASFEFTASKPISNHARNLGVPAAAFGAYGSTSTWYELAFPAGTTFGGLGIGNWGWTYKASVPEYKYVRVAVLDPKTHKQVIDRIHNEGGGKALFLTFDENVEKLAREAGLEVAFPAASLRTRRSSDAQHDALTAGPD